MRFRLTAFGLHVLGSATALTIILGILYFGWYRWPGWYLSGVTHVVGILIAVDLALGPTLTLIVANPGKPRRELARDIGFIVAVQIAALVYGASALWQGRPLYYTFSGSSLDMVQASDIDAHELALARAQNPAFAPHWYSLPRQVWAPLPGNSDEATRIVLGTTFGGADVTDMPRYFKAWEQGLPELQAHLTRLDDIKSLSVKRKQSLRSAMSARGLSPDERNALIMWGADSRRVLAVFDPVSLQIKALLKSD